MNQVPHEVQGAASPVNSSDQTAALDKIRRLLKLGASPNEHEAQAALAFAAKLAKKYSIDLGCVNAEEARERVAERSFDSRMAFDHVERAAATLCNSLFNVRCLFGICEATFIGLTHNVEAALFAHSFIVEQCGRDVKAFKKQRARHRCRASKGAVHQYCIGWTIGVMRRYKQDLAAASDPAQIEDSKEALVLSDQQREVDDYMASRHGESKEHKERKYKRDDRALYDGIADGREVAINRPLKSGEETLRLTA